MINCAGRTRSIIGTASLMRMGLRNVRALKNGTMGWVLAGLELESMPRRPSAAAPSESRKRAQELALRIAADQKISWISARELIDSPVKGSGVTYLIDVRSETEYETGHIPGSLSVPGGQAVQRADDFVAVKNARMVFVSGQSARAVMAAYWYGEMGFRHVQVLSGGLQAWRAERGIGRRRRVAQRAPWIRGGEELARRLAPGAVNSLVQSSSASLLHVGSSADFAAAHLPGSKWISRGWLELKLPALLSDRAGPIVLSCTDGRSSTLAARTLVEMGYQDVFALDGGIENWKRVGYPTVGGLESLPYGTQRRRVIALRQRRQGSDAALPGMGNQTHAVSCSGSMFESSTYSDRFGSSRLCPKL